MNVFTNHDLIFNDFNFSKLVYVENIRRPLVNINNYFKEGIDRIFYQTSVLKPPVIEIDIHCVRDTRSDVEKVKQTLIKHLYTTYPSKLITRNSDKYDLAVLSGDIDWTKFLNTATCTLTFQTIYPFQFGLTHVLDVVNGGILVPNGSYPTRGIFEINIQSNVNEIKITNEINSEFIKINDSFSIGKKIIIDCINEDVIYDNKNIISKLDLNSDFFDLIPNKQNKIKMEGVNKATFKYTERWL